MPERVRSLAIGLIFSFTTTNNNYNNQAEAITSPTDTCTDDTQDCKCKLYLAKSTIPGAGMGVFAGVDFNPDDTIMPGDLMVPIDNMPFHSGSTSWQAGVSDFFLWSDYTWDSSIASGAAFDYTGLVTQEEDEDNETVLNTVEIASFGLGAMPNCKFGFVNIEAGATLVDTADLDRNSPANGAFTPYHERVGKARGFVTAGSELFEDYGEEYFTNRPMLQLVPHEEDYDKADDILKLFGELRKKLGKSSNPLPMTAILRDIYNITKTAWNARVMNALPNPPQGDDYYDDNQYRRFLATILTQKSIDMEKKNTIRDVKWLKKEGICMDGLRAGTSNIPHAGRGAFATKAFQKAQRIVPVPLIHMPQKDILTMYAPIIEDGEETDVRDLTKPIGAQLFLNYVFGHKNSTVLISPYGHITSLLNHGSGQAANARMVWATEWMRNPEWLELTPAQLLEQKYAGLGWDLIALRDIQEGEEVLIDYGPEWEEAWEKHVTNWNANNNKTTLTGTPFPYVPAKELNENKEQVLLDAVKNNVDYSYMGFGVRLFCYYYGTAIPRSSLDDALQECRPVKAYKCPETGEQLFLTEIIEWEEGEEEWEVTVLDLLFDVPASIFHFEEDPYTTAHRMPWAFRHAMAIPDDLLPEKWRNIQ